MGCDTQLVQIGSGNYLWELFRGNVQEELHVQGNVQGNARISKQDYKSLRVAAIISATMVNTQTHTHTHIDKQTAFDHLYY